MEPSESELFEGLMDALAKDASYIVSTSTAVSRAELDQRVHNLTFEYNTARALMLTALAGRDAAYVERDMAITARVATIIDRDAHRAYSDEVVTQARHILESQDNTIRMAMTLPDHVDMLERELRSAP